MFSRLHTARYLGMQAPSGAAVIGSTGAVAHIPRIHQEGRIDRTTPGQPEVGDALCQLLGFTPELWTRILDSYA